MEPIYKAQEADIRLGSDSSKGDPVIGAIYLVLLIIMACAILRIRKSLKEMQKLIKKVP